MTSVDQSHRALRSIPRSDAARLPWSPPRLRELGSVAASTHAIDTAGRNDGGSGNMKRT